MRKWKLNVKVGDKVAVERGRHYEKFDIVKRITPTGIIKLEKLDTYTFSPQGRERNSSTDTFYSRYQIRELTPELEVKLTRQFNVERLTNYNYTSIEAGEVIINLVALLDKYEVDCE